jgi:hypothetical protein
VEGNETTKAERFEEFIKRLAGSTAASSFEEAFCQLCEILNAVEDELTSVPFNPAKWQTDGRMYPPQRDALRSTPGRPDLRRFRSKLHNTLIGEDGSIEIQDLSGATIFSKPGRGNRTD